jgi:diaminopimelate decarboxylase
VEQAAALIERYFPPAGGKLHIGGAAISTLAAKYGTPFFVYSREAIDEKWDLLRRTLPREFSILYSVKANPNQTILRHFLSKGAGLEIASGGEFCQALSAGCPPEKILFAGPGKTEAELELVLKQRIGEIHIESANEARRIGELCRRLGLTTKAAIRVNPDCEAEGGAMRMGGRATPFGTDEESLDEILDLVLSITGIEFTGIHLFTGTQILDFQVLLTQYRKGLEIALKVARRLKRPLQTVDFGGGLGIPYFSHEHELDMESARGGIESLMRGVRSEPLFSGTRFLVEPGRYLVGEAGIYVTSVIDVKVSRGKKFLVVDGGMNHHLAASGNLGQTIKRNYPIAILNKLQHIEPASLETVDVVGPLCTPLDVLARGVQLPHAEVGDLIGVLQSGAYARSASPLGFLSHPAPPEVWVDHGKDQLIRRRGAYADYLLDQLPNPLDG